MAEGIDLKYRKEGSPEDSGEWRAVPLRFRKLPRNRQVSQYARIDRDSMVASALLFPGAQMAAGFLMGSVAALISACMRWSGGEYLFFAVPFFAGALPSALLTLLLTGGRRFRWMSVLGPLMFVQLGWLIFLCFPEWGWVVVVYVCLPCIVGAAAGVLAIHARSRWFRA